VQERSDLFGVERVVKFPRCFLVISPHRLHRLPVRFRSFCGIMRTRIINRPRVLWILALSEEASFFLFGKRFPRKSLITCTLRTSRSRRIFLLILFLESRFLSHDRIPCFASHPVSIYQICQECPIATVLAVDERFRWSRIELEPGKTVYTKGVL